MKKHYPFYLLCVIGSLLSLSAQEIQYNLTCSADGNSYEVFVTRTVTADATTFIGSSIITLVLPTGSTRTVAHINETPSIVYNAVTPIIDGNSTSNDFYSFNTSGGQSLSGLLVVDTPVLWLTLTPSDGVNQDARLFINGSDPNDIGDVNPSNVFSTLSPGGIVDEYDSNISDSVINCSTLSTEEAIVLNDLELYPNPTSGLVNIRGNTRDLTRVEVYSLSGQSVMEKSNDLEQLDISALQASVYMVRLYNSNGSNRTIRLVKQ